MFMCEKAIYLLIFCYVYALLSMYDVFAFILIIATIPLL